MEIQPSPFTSAAYSCKPKIGVISPEISLNSGNVVDIYSAVHVDVAGEDLYALADCQSR